MPIKLALDMDDEFWKEVRKFQIDHEYNTRNEAVLELIRCGLKSYGIKVMLEEKK